MVPFTRRILEGWSTPEVFRNALKHVDEGDVVSARFENGVVSGMIRRQPRALKTSVRVLDDLTADSDCPCRDNRDHGIVCWHVIALCLDLLDQAADPQRQAKLEQERKRAERLAAYDEAQYIERRPEGSPDAEAARIRVGLAAHWREGVGIDRIPLTCGIATSGGTVPADQWPTDRAIALPAADENLLFVLEDICEGPVSGLFEAKRSDFLNLLDLLKGRALHGENLRVMAEPAPSGLGLELNQDTGELVLFLSTRVPGLETEAGLTYVVAGTQGWVVGPRTAHPLKPVLPGPLQDLYESPVYVERRSVPRFFETELPALRAIMEIDTELDGDLLDRRPATPSFRLLVKGSPASLSAELRAVYDDDIELIANKPDAEGQFAFPEEDDLLAYRVRNLPAEKRALGELHEVGFGGDMGDNMRAIVGQRLVNNFLASDLPRLRRKGWRVDLEGRVEGFFDEAEFATPVVSVRAPDGLAGAPGPAAGFDAASGEDGNWFEVSFDFDAGGTSLSAADIQRAIRMGDSHVKVGDRTVLFDRDAVESMNAVFNDCASGEASQPGAFRMQGIHAAYVKESLDGLDGVDVEAPPTWIRRAEVQNRDGKLKPVPLGPPLDGILRPYQKEGVNWLRFWEENGYAGILADEMGLGKTLQTLCWLQLPRAVGDDGEHRPALIVCPTSLVENWIEEGAKFTPKLSFVNLTGPDRQDRFPLLETTDVGVTSYALLRRDLDALNLHGFSAVVLDEAQHIKNPGSQNAKAAKRLRAGSKLVLTGTPVENRVTDLWSIMDFLMPGYMGGQEHFRTYYEGPIGRGGPDAEAAQTKLRRKLHPFLLRRLKRDVAKDLPPKIEQVTRCSLSPDQKKVYKEMLEASRRRLFDMVGAQGFNKSRMEIFKTLLRLRQICCHLGLLDLPDLESEQPSAKLDLFHELLDEARDGGHRILVFSQFTSMLGLIRESLVEGDIRHSYLDGSTRNRLELVKEFNRDEGIPVFLISLKAGGTGLNLTGADMVVHFDPWWNPAVENQATDRAYRIGQKRTVVAHKLIARDTVEEKVLELQEKKKRMIDATLTTDEEVLRKLSWDDVQDLLAL